MILIDISQVLISNLHMSLKGNIDIQLDENRLRNMILHSIRHYKQKFSREYGDLVICCDSRVPSWRREIFPYYKIRRVRNKERSALDWRVIVAMFDKILGEISDNFPYRIIRVDRAEADDIIGTLCHHFGDTEERILIISTDGDFIQLLRYDNVAIYNHTSKSMTKCRRQTNL